MKRFYEVVGDVVIEALDANVVSVGKEALNRDFVGRVTVADDGVRSTELLDMVQDSVSLRGVTMRGEMKAKHKASFAVYDKPDVMLFAFDFDNSFVSVPFVRVEVHRGDDFDSDIIKERRELYAPVGDGNV